MTARVYPSQQDTYLTAIGSLLVTYEEVNQTTNVSQVQCFVNSVERKLIHNNTDKLYSTFISNGDIVRILLTTTSDNNEIDVTRRDYTTDDQGGDMGIRDVYITGVTGTSPTTLEVTFTVSPISLDYNFEYLISASVQYPVTPTPTPTVTPTSTPTPAPFIFDISIGSGQSFTLPYYSGATYNGLINWGDTTSSTNSYANKSHTYSVGGTYTITISGTISQWSFYHVSTNAQNITGIRQWGSLQFLNNDGRYFFLCRSLSSMIATDAPNLIGVTNLGDMFADTNFNNSLNNWNVSGITNMAGMFTGANQFNGNITSWDVSNVTTMQSMFNGAFAFNQNIGSWNVSNVTNMAGMFLGAQQFNQNIGSWNVSNVTTMQQMFYAAYSFNQNISNWSVNNVINMQQLFEDAVSFNQNLSNWCAVNIPSEPYNFAVGATSYILPRPNWGCLTSTPTPTPTSTSVTPTPTPTNTPTNTVTPSITPTPTVTPTNTNTPTVTPTPSSTPGFIPIITSGLTIYGDANLGHSYPGTGTIITDLSGNGYNGNLINGTSFSGGTPSSFKYDGVNDYIQFPGYNGPGIIDYTWGCWVRLNSGQPTMWMKGQSSSDWGLRLEMDNTGQFNAGAAASLTSGGTISGVYAYSTTIIPNITSWYYIVGVWDSATSIKFYLNGVLESTTLTSNGFLRNSTLGWNSGIYGTTFSNNWVADFEVYARVLSDAEVLYNYNANKAKYGY